MRFNSVFDLTGDTPVVRLNNLSNNLASTLWLKLEAYNPTSSSKFRAAYHMISEAEKQGEISPGDIIVESTSGNLGVALSMVGVQKGYRVICVVDPKIPKNSQRLIESYGGEIHSIDSSTHSSLYLQERIKTVKYLTEKLQNAYWPNQYSNSNNPDSHFKYTSQEILNDFKDGLDAVVIAVSSAGTISGVARGIKEKSPNTKIIAVDAEGSAIFGRQPKKRLLNGIGSSITPSNLDTSLIDEIYHISDEEAFGAVQQLAKKEGLLLGGSTGCVLQAALQVANKLPGSNPQILGISPDSGERYLDTIFCEDWLKEKSIEVGNTLLPI